MEFKKILVPVNGTELDEKMLRLACSLARRDRGKLYVVYVVQIKRQLPLDADNEPEIKVGEGVLNRAQGFVQEQDCNVEADLLQAREVGPALVEEAVVRGVDLILVGIDYKQPFGEFSLGQIIPYLLKNALCRVLICREPMPSTG